MLMYRKMLYIWDIHVFNTYRYSVVPHETSEESKIIKFIEVR